MTALLVAEYIGIASAATSGFIFAVKRDCDWLGIFIAALLTALGGGFMRDAIVSRRIRLRTTLRALSLW